MLSDRYLTATAVVVIVHEEVVKVNFKPGDLLRTGRDKSNTKYLWALYKIFVFIMYQFYVLFCVLYFAARMNKLILYVILEKNVHDVWNLNKKTFGIWSQKQNNWTK